jgi:hypothetical protein
MLRVKLLQVLQPDSVSSRVIATHVVFFMIFLPREWLGRQATTVFDPQLYVTNPVVQTMDRKFFEIAIVFLTLIGHSSVTVSQRHWILCVVKRFPDDGGH